MTGVTPAARRLPDPPPSSEGPASSDGSPSSGGPRTRADRCPGVLRPWPAEDGLLVRLRLIGGRVATASLGELVGVAERHGDGRVHLTGRANLQLRGLPGGEGMPAVAVLDAIERTGLLPTRSHELVRNVMVSPQSGLAGGRADLRSVASELDRLIRADARLADLPGRFLFVLDDGRGDLVARRADLLLIALDESTVQLRVGTQWGETIPLPAAAEALVDLAATFARRRGTGPSAPWHVAELPSPLVAAAPPDSRVPEPVGALAFGQVPGGRHVALPDGLDRAALQELGDVPEVVVTPWRGVLVPEAPDA